MKNLIFVLTLFFNITYIIGQGGLEVNHGTTNNLNGNTGYGIFGNPGGETMGIDNNGIQTRIGNIGSTLFLNYYGGHIDILGLSNSTGNFVVDQGGFYYDNATNRIGLSDNSPAAKLDINAAGNSNAINIISHTANGVQISGGNYGLYTHNQDVSGLWSNNAGSHGVRVTTAGGNGGRFQNVAASDFTAIYAGHGDDTKFDLGLGGFGRVVTDESLSIQLDNNNNGANDYFNILRKNPSGNAYVFWVYENGNGYFAEDLFVNGNVSKGGGSFKIDHPLDPENKYLYHSFVESPDMMNVYNGNVSTDESGFATINMPDWFDTLNRDFRYQLSTIGSFAQVMVVEELNNNQFVIQSSEPHTKVSWQITGIRHDNYAKENRIEVEVEKEAHNKGKYLHPTAWEKQTGRKNLARTILPEESNQSSKTAIMEDDLSESQINKIQSTRAESTNHSKVQNRQ